jgi:hypothetical protein
VTSLLLGIRLALRGSRTRVAVTSLALAFTVSFLLAVLGALPARQAKLDRLDARQPLSAGTMAAPGQRPTGGVLRLAGIYTWWRGHVVEGFQVVDAPASAPVPPGLSRLPAPGELVVSPALAEALRGSHRTELVSRFPGKVVGEIGSSGLSGPREYFAWVGVRHATGDNPPQVALRFGVHRDKAAVGKDLMAAARLGAIGLLLPVLVLVATATGLSAGARERRLAAIRLVGGSPGQVGWILAGEALVVGALGAVLGLGVFVALRPLAARLVPVEGGVFATDLLPPTNQLVGVLLLVPLLALAVSLLAVRRLVVDPLGVRRRGRRRSRAGWWRLVPLSVGLAMLGVMWLRHKNFVGLDLVLLLGGGALTIVGLAVVAPAVSRLAGALLVRLPGVAPRLAGRRLMADPSATARTLTGTVLVVFVGTWLLAWLPVLKVSQGNEERSLSHILPGSTIWTHPGREPGPASAAALRRIRGVRQVVVIGTAQLAKPGFVEVTDNSSADYPTQVAVVRCPDLAELLHEQLPCGSASVFRMMDAQTFAYGPSPTGRRVFLGSDGKAAGTVVLPAQQAVLHLGLDASALLQSDTVVDPSLLPAAATRAYGSQLLVRTDGDPGTTERVRNALDADGVYGASTLGEQLANEEMVVRGYERAARLGLVLAVLVGGIGLLVSTVDALRARRRDLASLAALGVPVGVLRRALLLETAAPLVGCTALALGSGAFAAAAYLAGQTFYREKVGLPWSTWSGVAGASMAVVLAVVVLTLPLARSATRPAYLRNE